MSISYCAGRIQYSLQVFMAEKSGSSPLPLGFWIECEASTTTGRGALWHHRIAVNAEIFFVGILLRVVRSAAATAAGTTATIAVVGLVGVGSTTGAAATIAVIGGAGRDAWIPATSVPSSRPSWPRGDWCVQLRACVSKIPISTSPKQKSGCPCASRI